VPENPDWVEFARAMMPLMSYPAEVMATELAKGGEAKKVLDIAASHGVFWNRGRATQSRGGDLRGGLEERAGRGGGKCCGGGDWPRGIT